MTVSEDQASYFEFSLICSNLFCSAGVVVGFANQSVTVRESAGFARLTVSLTGLIERNVTVRFTTSPGTANGKANYFTIN